MCKAQTNTISHIGAVQVKGFTKGAKTFNCLSH